MRRFIFVPLAICVMLVSGCATKSALYSWGDYEPQIYQYFNGESPEKMVFILEKTLDESKKTGSKAPPGFHAHLAILYQSLGRDQDFLAMIELEKRNYPESRKYMDFLLKNYKR